MVGRGRKGKDGGEGTPKGREETETDGEGGGRQEESGKEVGRKLINSVTG